jgi:5-methylcytosine-specific restriction endonuclease McrA
VLDARRGEFAPTPSQNRMTGRALQARRLRVWTKNPHCAHCGRLTSYPGGFELDHIEALVNGGADTDDNCQVLCIEAGDASAGCHAAKTRRDLGR